MSAAWDELFDEVRAWRRAGAEVGFWWRDDDACRATPELTRLLTLAQDSGAPLALAVIPQAAEAAAFSPWPFTVAVLQHGVTHVNRAASTQKKSEFPESEPVQEGMNRLLQGREQLRQIFGERALPVLAPPWNRFPKSWVAELAAHGYRGLSTFLPRGRASPASGLIQVNTHVDIVDWRHGKKFIGEEQALSLACEQLRLRRRGAADHTEPVGWLTHHAVHEEAAWRFLAELLQRTKELPGLRWLHPREVFGLPVA